MTSVLDDLPDSGTRVIVKIDDSDYAIAYYTIGFGFEPDCDALEIFVHDDSGLYVEFSGKVTHWGYLPKE